MERPPPGRGPDPGARRAHDYDTTIVKSFIWVGWILQ
jgi:hypothetical protein